MKQKTEEVKSLLEKKLKIGDERQKVEDVLKDAGILYAYDQFQNRYQSTITDPLCGSGQAISVYVYFDSSKKMSKVEVFESYAGL